MLWNMKAEKGPQRGLRNMATVNISRRWNALTLPQDHCELSGLVHLGGTLVG